MHYAQRLYNLRLSLPLLLLLYLRLSFIIYYYLNVKSIKCDIYRERSRERRDIFNIFFILNGTEGINTKILSKSNQK